MRLVGLAAIFLLAPVLAAQDPGEVRIHSGVWSPAQAAISVQTNLVELAATVTDSHGRAVGGLHAADFEVLDAGQQQHITFFSEQSSRPTSVEASTGEAERASAAPKVTAREGAGQDSLRYVALFFDDTNATAGPIGRARSGAEALVKRGLDRLDRIGIFTNSQSVTVDFTNDARRLLDGLARIRPHPLRAGGGFSKCPTLTAFQAYVIAQRMDIQARTIAVDEAVACHCMGADLSCVTAQEGLVQDTAESVWNQLRSDSVSSLEVLQSVVRYLANAHGRRILIILSPGFITGGMEKQTSAILDTALRSQIVIQSLDSEGLIGDAGESPESLNERYASTGRETPRFEWAQRSLGLRQQLLASLMADASAATGGRFIQNSNDLADAVRTLAAEPEVSYLLGFVPPNEPDGKYHRLSVRVDDHSLHVEARAGYFSAPLIEPIQDRINRLALSDEAFTDFPVAIRPTQRAGSVLHIDIKVDATRLKFAERRGRRVQELTFVTVIEDPAGNYISGKQAVMDLTLTRATLSGLRSKGIQAVTNFSLPRGTYQVREVIREAVENRMAASTVRFILK